MEDVSNGGGNSLHLAIQQEGVQHLMTEILGILDIPLVHHGDHSHYLSARLAARTTTPSGLLMQRDVTAGVDYRRLVLQLHREIVRRCGRGQEHDSLAVEEG